MLAVITLFRAKNSSTIPTLVKSLEDPELYLSFFREHFPFLHTALVSSFGFYGADVAVFSFWVALSSIAAICLFTLFKKRTKISPWALVLIVFSAIVLSRKYYELATFSGIRNVLSSQSSWWSRFFQPGLSLGCMLLVQTLIENLPLSNKKRCLALLAIAFCSAVIPTYPWIALIYSVFLLCSLLVPNTFLEIRIYALICILLSLTLKFLGTHPDLVTRVGAYSSIWPEPITFRNTLIVAVLLLFFIKQPLAKFLLGFQLSTLAAQFSSIRGFTVEPDHFQLIHLITVPGIVVLFIEKYKFDQKWKFAQWAFGLILAGIAVIGLRSELSWKHPSFYSIPKEYVEVVKNVTFSCGPHKPYEYFYSSDAYLNWTLPARTRCKNILHMGRLDWNLSNQEIATRYLASKMFYEHKSRSAALHETLEDLKFLGSSHHEWSRDLTKSTALERRQDHMLWYGFLSGFYLPSQANHLKKLFFSANVNLEIKQLKEFKVLNLPLVELR